MARFNEGVPRSLLLVRTGATLVISMAICQAGLAAGTFFSDADLLGWHKLFGYVTLAVSILTAILSGLYIRDGGPMWVLVFSIVVAVWAAVQVTLGELGVASLHAFTGVLFAMLATALTSWVFRHQHVPRSTGASAGRRA